MAGGGDGKEMNYWPGFVDALSNVVLTLVFVLVVFVFALMITSSKIKNQAKHYVQETVEAEESNTKKVGMLNAELNELAAGKEKLMGELAAAKSELDATKLDAAAAKKALEELKKGLEEKEIASTPSVIDQRLELANEGQTASKKANGETPDVETGAAIIITFPRSVIALNDRSKADLTKAISAHKSEIAGTKAVLDAYAGPETYSEGMRSAYYRGLDVRNFLIDKGYGTKQTIVVNTKQSKVVGDARVELRFVRN
jgi:hypothetical protein